MLPTGSVIVRVTLAAVGVVTLGGVYIAVLPLLAIVPSEAVHTYVEPAGIAPPAARFAELPTDNSALIPEMVIGGAPIATRKVFDDRRTLLSPDTA